MVQVLVPQWVRPLLYSFSVITAPQVPVQKYRLTTLIKTLYKIFDFEAKIRYTMDLSEQRQPFGAVFCWGKIGWR